MAIMKVGFMHVHLPSAKRGICGRCRKFSDKESDGGHLPAVCMLGKCADREFGQAFERIVLLLRYRSRASFVWTSFALLPGLRAATTLIQSKLAVHTDHAVDIRSLNQVRQ